MTVLIGGSVTFLGQRIERAETKLLAPDGVLASLRCRHAFAILEIALPQCITFVESMKLVVALKPWPWTPIFVIVAKASFTPPSPIPPMVLFRKDSLAVGRPLWNIDAIHESMRTIAVRQKKAFAILIGACTGSLSAFWSVDTVCV